LWQFFDDFLLKILFFGNLIKQGIIDGIVFCEMVKICHKKMDGWLPMWLHQKIQKRIQKL